MRILHIVSGLQKASGVTTFVENLVAELRLRGHMVEVVTKETPREDFSCALSSFDIVHIHGLWDFWLHRWAGLARRNGLPIIWSTHGMTAPWAMRHKWWKKCAPWHFYQGRDLSEANILHCTSELEVRWNKRLGFNEFCTAPLGTVLPRDVSVSGKMRSSHGFNCKTLLFVGRIYPVKALDLLIEAFAMAVANAKVGEAAEKWCLRLVGPDQSGHMMRLMALCDKLNIPYSEPTQKGNRFARIQFVGSLFNGELDAEYAKCDALALVSHTENFGATIVDAMAHGKPVIAGTDTPWKIVADRGCGWWCDNASTTLATVIAELMSLSDGERAAMGARGRKLVEEKYTWKAVCDAMVEGYRKVFEKRRSLVRVNATDSVP